MAQITIIITLFLRGTTIPFFPAFLRIGFSTVLFGGLLLSAGRAPLLFVVVFFPWPSLLGVTDRNDDALYEKEMMEETKIVSALLFDVLVATHYRISLSLVD